MLTAAIIQYDQNGSIDVVTCDAGPGACTHINGVVPVPPEYLTSLKFDFADLDQPGGTQWSFLKSGADTIRMLCAEPLTREQIDHRKQAR